MSDDLTKCPHCGAERIREGESMYSFACASYAVTYDRPHGCHIAENHKFKRENAALKAENERLRHWLLEISKGEGRYNHDPLTHADNCIDDMKALALAALDGKEADDA